MSLYPMGLDQYIGWTINLADTDTNYEPLTLQNSAQATASSGLNLALISISPHPPNQRHIHPDPGKVVTLEI